MIIQTLSMLECTSLLTRNRLAHIACVKDGRPYVVPVFYAYAESSLYAFSMPGKKIEWMRECPAVSAQIDEQGKGRNWKSVVVDGRYEELPNQTGQRFDREHAWSLLSKHFDWWEPGALKPDTHQVSDHSTHVFFRIIVDSLSGRGASD